MRAPPFYLVWHEDGGEPRQKHADQHLAEREAERLARVNPGDRFYVLAPVAAIRRSDIERERFDLGELEVPF